MITEESSGARRDALHIREMIRQMGQQKVSRWLAVAAVVVPVIWGASKIDSMTTVISRDMIEMTETFTHEIAGLTREISGLRAEIGEIRGAQGAQALIVVKLEKDAEHATIERKRISVAVDTLEYQVNNLGANMKTARRELDWIRHGKPLPPNDGKGGS